MNEKAHTSELLRPYFCMHTIIRVGNQSRPMKSKTPQSRAQAATGEVLFILCFRSVGQQGQFKREGLWVRTCWYGPLYNLLLSIVCRMQSRHELPWCPARQVNGRDVTQSVGCQPHVDLDLSVLHPPVPSEVNSISNLPLVCVSRCDQVQSKLQALLCVATLLFKRK